MLPSNMLLLILILPIFVTFSTPTPVNNSYHLSFASCNLGGYESEIRGGGDSEVMCLALSAAAQKEAHMNGVHAKGSFDVKMIPAEEATSRRRTTLPGSHPTRPGTVTSKAPAM